MHCTVENYFMKYEHEYKFIGAKIITADTQWCACKLHNWSQIAR